MIEVRRTGEGDPLEFAVVVREGQGETHHNVTMARETCDRLAAGKHTPEECLEAAFRFLLDREPKEPQPLWALAHAGDLEGGIAEIERGVTHWVGTGAVLHSTHHRAVLAAACCAAGDLERGRMHLAVARRHVDDFGERYAEAELYRIGAQLRLREGAPAEKVEAELRRAIEIAEAQGARLWQLRAAIDLARLWRDYGRSEAHDLLAPIYDWFTEGFGTADLKQAKALLDELQ